MTEKYKKGKKNMHEAIILLLQHINAPGKTGQKELSNAISALSRLLTSFERLYELANKDAVTSEQVTEFVENAMHNAGTYMYSTKPSYYENDWHHNKHDYKYPKETCKCKSTQDPDWFFASIIKLANNKNFEAIQKLVEVKRDIDSNSNK